MDVEVMQSTGMKMLFHFPRHFSNENHKKHCRWRMEFQRVSHFLFDENHVNNNGIESISKVHYIFLEIII